MASMWGWYFLESRAPRSLMRLQMLLAVLAVLLATGIVVTRLVSRIIRALSNGMDLLQRISKGDLTAVADASLLRRSDEIGLLGNEINALRSELLDTA